MTELHIVQMGTGNARAACLARERKYVHQARARWTPDTFPTAPVGSENVLYEVREGKASELIYDSQSALVFLEGESGGTLAAFVYSDSMATAEKTLAAIQKAFPESRMQGKEIRVFFWNHSSHGPQSRARKLVAPAWEEIEGNYGRMTMGALEALRAATPDPVESGKLILWHGSPGTGKTYALRALAQNWSEWATIHYIVDPEHFFGQHADYMLAVLLGDSDAPPGVETKEQWRLIVLEDTGELLSKDAKERAGQGLSRLLNVCDGLIGQGLRVLVLITTNEDAGSLHSAITRPGRCLADVRFDSLTMKESTEWCQRNDALRPGAIMEKRQYSLAELFALKSGFAIDTPKLRIVGFGN